MTGPSNTFLMECVDIFGNPRKMVLKLVFTLLLGLPFILANMPGAVRISGIGFLVLFSSFFGASVGMVRKKTAGLTIRLTLLPIPGIVWLSDFALAGAVMDFLQTGTILALYLLIHGQGVTPGAVLLTATLFAMTVLILNVLGIMLGQWLSSNAEVHLTGAFMTLILAFASGLVPMPERLRTIQGTAAQFNPLNILLKVLKGCAEGGTHISGIHIILSLAVIAGLTAVTGYRWLKR